MRKNISVTNELVIKLLTTSDNASKLIEESVIFLVYAIENGLMSKNEVNRIFAQKLIKF